MKTLYLECAMGAAGDMLMAALWELAEDKAGFLHKMNHLFPGLQVQAEESEKCGLRGTHMRVTVHGEEEHSHDVDGHGHHHGHEHEHHHDHEEHEHHHDHEHEGHEHHHDHDDHDHDDHDHEEHEHHHHDHDHECDDPNCSCHHHHHHADEVFTSWGKETPKVFTQADIQRILTALDSGDYGKILRAKGIVNGEGGQWIEFDFVPEEHEVRAGHPDYTGRLCVIGAELKEDKLSQLFGL